MQQSQTKHINTISTNKQTELFFFFFLLLLLLFIEGPVNRTGSPSRLFSSSILTHVGQPAIQYKTHTLYKRKTSKHNPKVSPFRYCSRKKKKRQIKCGNVGTIDRFALAFLNTLKKRQQQQRLKVRHYQRNRKQR